MIERKYSGNRSLFGLRTDSSFRIKYDADSGLVTEIVGAEASLSGVELSDSTAFNLPHYIVFEGIPYFPSKYEFTSGEVWYHARRPPSCRIELNRPYGVLSDNAKTMRVRIAP